MTTQAPTSNAALDEEDRHARQQALDVTRSFLVQAPAGSGKTELLIQRYLALLPTVERPEEIVAMTFTRKTAGEMRERITDALRAAAAGVPVTSTHAQRTRDLALAALRCDASRQWNLIAHPARLSVVTIDAYCAGLAGQAPLSTRLGASPRYLERATALYRRAVHDALADAAPDAPEWRRLLAHVDNEVSRLVDLLAGLLAQREQWLPILLTGDADAFRSALEASLKADVDGELAALHAALSPLRAGGLCGLQAHAAAEMAQSSPIADALQRMAGGDGLPVPRAAALADWQALADWLLLAGKARFRTKVDVRQGFAPAGKGPGAVTRAARKEEVQALLAALAMEPGLAALLDAARRLPPIQYTDDAWSIVGAMLSVLPQVAQRLLLVFHAEAAIDFTQGTLAALAALGTADDPQELLLRLDYAVRHLLIDEFQDTSYPQLELVEQLTAGWMPGDGRSLFVVGDPMQSIYRFRAAEVRLFIEAQAARRIGGVDVLPLTLRRNFRAQAGLVDWVNAVFREVLGEVSDPWRGAVAFAPAMAELPPLPNAVTVERVADDDAESVAVIAAIRAAQENAGGNVAVLVRARSHLDRLLPALRDASIAFTAVDLDALSQRPAVLDLATLTHAIVQPADRLAWLAILRAPWCGLVLADLLAVANAAVGIPVAAAALGPDAIPGLSDDGRARLERFAAALRPTLASVGRAQLSRRVHGAWLALAGPATIDDAADLAAAEMFFALLARHERAGDIADWDALIADLDALRAGADDAAAADAPGARVQVMTLHRAKGLEFDTVIMPGLARKPPRGDRPLLRWRRRPQGLLLAPSRRRGGDDDPIYAYLSSLADDETDAELGRLLYVGCTRARRHLHLVAVVRPQDASDAAAGWRAPDSGSSLAKLWPALSAALPAPGARDAVRGVAERVPPRLRRLPLTWQCPLPPASMPFADVAPKRTRAPIEFDWAQAAARHVGVVAHRVFAQIAREGLAAWNRERVRALRKRLAIELAGEGVDGAGMSAAIDAVVASVLGVVDEVRGRWLFAPDHLDATSEWALSGIDAGSVARIVIDRTFVADGVRWIVDFKTSLHEGSDLDAFLDREVERYRDQLARYARFVRTLDPRPIRLGLYYPRFAGWRVWETAD